MASLATEDQAKLAIKMHNKTKQYVANEYKHRKQTTETIVHKRKIKDIRNLLKKNNSRKQRPVMHEDQKNI